jgi:hypothetical protein
MHIPSKTFKYLQYITQNELVNDKIVKDGKETPGVNMNVPASDLTKPEPNKIDLPKSQPYKAEAPASEPHRIDTLKPELNKADLTKPALKVGTTPLKTETLNEPSLNNLEKEPKLSPKIINSNNSNDINNNQLSFTSDSTIITQNIDLSKTENAQQQGEEKNSDKAETTGISLILFLVIVLPILLTFWRKNSSSSS